VDRLERREGLADEPLIDRVDPPSDRIDPPRESVREEVPMPVPWESNDELLAKCEPVLAAVAMELAKLLAAARDEDSVAEDSGGECECDMIMNEMWVPMTKEEARGDL